MRSTDYPYDHERTAEVWRAFRAGEFLSPSPVDPLVVDSWRRCQTAAVAASLPERRSDTDAALISTVLPYLEDIAPHVLSIPGVMLIAAQDGVLLTMQGDCALKARLQSLGMDAGMCWAEPYLGTNAVSLSLVTAMPTQVVGAEHSLDRLHAFGGSAAPIYDDQGAIIGIIAIIAAAQHIDQTQLALMMTTAQAISAQLQSGLLLHQANQRTRMLTSILESVTDGVITWDTHGSIEHANSMAMQILGIESKALLGRSLQSLIGFTDHIQKAIDERRQLSDAEASLRLGDRFVKCLLNIRAIRDGTGEVVGGIMMLRPVAQVRSLVHQHTSTPALLTFADFEFTSPRMHSLLRHAKVAAKGSSPVLVSGEAGSGKTVLAQAIHNASPRGNRPLVVLHCGMIPNELMVEELLGREAHGTETGRPSKFELADGGTLVLDQIDQLSLEAQRILLQVLNSRSVTRLHADRMTQINVRIVATTTVDLEARVGIGAFRPQLYYQLNIFHLTIPPLRKRREDIPRLALRFLERLRGDAEPPALDDEVLNMLRSYPWPGNVRELESVIERAVISAANGIIGAADLPENVRTGISLNPQSALVQPVQSLDEAERDAIIRAGWACGGSTSEMALLLGIDRSTLWRKLRRYGIPVGSFKEG